MKDTGWMKPWLIPFAIFGLSAIETDKHDHEGHAIIENRAILSDPNAWDTESEALDSVLALFIARLKPFGIEARVNTDLGGCAKIAQNHLVLDKVANTRQQEQVFGDKNLPKKITKKHNCAFYLYCSRCFNTSKANLLHECRWEPVAEGKFDLKHDEEAQTYCCDIIVTNCWFHDVECTTLPYYTYADLINRRVGQHSERSVDPMALFEVSTFDYEAVVGDAYDALVEHVETTYTDPMVDAPPGQPISFGFPDTYTFDDRRYERLPSTKLEDVLDPMRHCYAMMRISYWYINLHGLQYQFTDEFPPIRFPQLPTAPVGSRGYGGRFYIGDSSLLSGGHDVDQTLNGRKNPKTAQEQEDTEQIHQICHADFKPRRLNIAEHGVAGSFSASDNPLTMHRQITGSLMIPIQNERAIYIGNKHKVYTIAKNEGRPSDCLFFPADLSHGGITRHYKVGDPPDWQLCLHTHLVSDGDPMFFDGVNIHASMDTYLPPQHLQFLSQSQLDHVVDHAFDYLGPILQHEQAKRKKKTRNRLQGLLDGDGEE